jgi:hypothetical protein
MFNSKLHIENIKEQGRDRSVRTRKNKRIPKTRNPVKSIISEEHA